MPTPALWPAPEVNRKNRKARTVYDSAWARSHTTKTRLLHYKVRRSLGLHRLFSGISRSLQVSQPLSQALSPSSPFQRRESLGSRHYSVTGLKSQTLEVYTPMNFTEKLSGLFLENFGRFVPVIFSLFFYWIRLPQNWGFCRQWLRSHFTSGTLCSSTLTSYRLQLVLS